MIKYWQKFKTKLSKLLGFFKLPGFAFATAFLGAYAGSEGTSKLWRRAGIAVVTTILAYVSLFKTVGWGTALWTLTIMSIWGSLAIGHGIPDSTDLGSALGRFWFKVFKGNHTLADIGTRGSIGLLLTINVISVPLLKDNWLVYVLGGLGIILVEALVSWRALGEIILKVGKKTVHLLWSDIINYAVIGTMYYLIIKY